MEMIPICWLVVTLGQGLMYRSLPGYGSDISWRTFRCGFWDTVTRESLGIPFFALSVIILWASVYYVSIEQVRNESADFDNTHRAGLAIVVDTGFDFCGCSMRMMSFILLDRARARSEAGLAPSEFEAHLQAYSVQPYRDLLDRHDAWDDFKIDLENKEKLSKQQIPQSWTETMFLIRDPMRFSQLVDDGGVNSFRRYFYDRLVAVVLAVQIDALFSCGGLIASENFPFWSWTIILLQLVVIAGTKWYTGKRIAEFMPQKHKLKMRPCLLVKKMKESVWICTELQKIFNDLPLREDRVIWAVHRMHSFTGMIPNIHH